MTKIIVTKDSLGEFINFTQYFQDIRSEYKDYFVYAVDLGEQEDHNIIMSTVKVVEGKMTNDTYELILSKDYFLENFNEWLTSRSK